MDAHRTHSIPDVIAGATLAAYYIRPASRQLPDSRRTNFQPGEYHPLFEPDEAELRELAAAEQQEISDAERLRLEHAASKRVAELNDFRDRWQAEPNRSRTIEVLYLASQTEIGDIYLETANKVIAAWQQGRIDGLESTDLAQLLESHYWLLPASQRSSGGNFGLRDEIARLRASN